MKEEILTVMTFEQLKEFNNKQKYPWNLELGAGYFYYYNPLYMNSKQGGFVISPEEDYNKFIDWLLVRDYFKFAKDSIDFDNKHLRDCEDYIEVGYNYEDENGGSIKYMKIQKNEQYINS